MHGHVVARVCACARKTPTQWYSIYKFLASDDMPRRWDILELKPGQKPERLADDLAAHFSKITNMSPPLKAEDIPKLDAGNGLIPQMCVAKIEKLLLSYKKCNWNSGTKPKTNSPGSMDDIQPISMTPLWSKILETMVAGFTLDETKKNWKNNQ